MSDFLKATREKQKEEKRVIKVHSDKQLDIDERVVLEVDNIKTMSSLLGYEMEFKLNKNTIVIKHFIEKKYFFDTMVLEIVQEKSNSAIFNFVLEFDADVDDVNSILFKLKKHRNNGKIIIHARDSKFSHSIKIEVKYLNAALKSGLFREVLLVIMEDMFKKNKKSC